MEGEHTPTIIQLIRSIDLAVIQLKVHIYSSFFPTPSRYPCSWLQFLSWKRAQTESLCYFSNFHYICLCSVKYINLFMLPE